jgi:hypothetical protein
MERVDLEVLGSRFVLRLPDARWRSFVACLWSASVVPSADGPATLVEVVADPDWEWRLLVDHEVQGAASDWWFVARELRYWVIKRAIDNAPEYLLGHAAVLARDERGVLLIARSGGGKTTLSLALVDRGWAHLSDDVAAIHASTGIVSPLPAPASIKDVTRWDEMSSFWSGVDVPRPEKEFLIPVSHLASGPTPQVGADLICFLEFGPVAQPRAVELTTGEAMALFSQHSGSLEPAAVGRYAEVCRRARCARLLYGSSAAGIELIEGLTAHSPKR